MRNLIFYACILSFVLNLTSCNKNDLEDISVKNNETNSTIHLLSINPTYSELEKHVRELNDQKAVFSYKQYEQLMQELLNDKFVVLPLNEFKDSIDNSKVYVCLRHDVDHHIFKALEMAMIEKEYGLRSTYYLLATSVYSGTFFKNNFNRFNCVNKAYTDLHRFEHEIGIHNDLLTIMIKHDLDPFQFNYNEISFYNNLGIEIYGTAAHGSTIARETVSNFQMFSDFAQSSTLFYNGKIYQLGEHSLSQYGYQYEAYFINNNKYFSDVGGKWNLNGGFDELINQLRNSSPGDRIQILTHPVWWGK